MKNLLIKNGKAIIGREVLNRDILISDGKIASADFTGKLPKTVKFSMPPDFMFRPDL